MTSVVGIESGQLRWCCPACRFGMHEDHTVGAFTLLRLNSGSEELQRHGPDNEIALQNRRKLLK